ncbi:L-lactate permease, partial [SAR202 cluster bacterium AD-802-E10_MRT_200m]|nr:L-lactate permease [SAR202 cluster bacterium AD-802-E10_MRT_200m]
MTTGPPVTLINWILASLPIICLISTILVFKWGAPRAGAVSLLVALVLALIRFGGSIELLIMASSKGLSLSLFILTILWTAVFLYNLISRLGSVEVIGTTLTRISGDRLGAGLLIAWVFSGFIQGIAGFGVPVAVVAPLMVVAGFRPLVAVVTVLVGHSWAVAFGSLGSPFYTIQLVTDIPSQTIGPQMALLLTPSIILSGLAVAHIIGGFNGLKRSIIPVIFIGSLMGLFTWLTAIIGAGQIGSIAPGIIGCGALWLTLKRIWNSPNGDEDLKMQAIKGDDSKGPMGFNFAFFPYYVLIIITAVSQIPMVKDAANHLYFGLNYPESTTALGYKISEEIGYARIYLFRHPAPLIIASLFLTYLLFHIKGLWRVGSLKSAAIATFEQSRSTTIGMATMVMMALVMIDTGMTSVLGQGIAVGTGNVFPFVSPFLGVLGT